MSALNATSCGFADEPLLYRGCAVTWSAAAESRAARRRRRFGCRRSRTVRTRVLLSRVRDLRPAKAMVGCARPTVQRRSAPSQSGVASARGGLATALHRRCVDLGRVHNPRSFTGAGLLGFGEEAQPAHEVLLAHAVVASGIGTVLLGDGDERLVAGLAAVDALLAEEDARFAAGRG